jgi:hypothetical protein
MGNLAPLLDLICRFWIGRRLSDQRGAGFGRRGCDRHSDLVLDAPGFAGQRAALTVAVGEAWPVPERWRCRAGAVIGDGDRGLMVMNCRARPVPDPNLNLFQTTHS